MVTRVWSKLTREPADWRSQFSNGGVWGLTAALLWIAILGGLSSSLRTVHPAQLNPGRHNAYEAQSASAARTVFEHQDNVPRQSRPQQGRAPAAMACE